MKELGYFLVVLGLGWCILAGIITWVYVDAGFNAENPPFSFTLPAVLPLLLWAIFSLNGLRNSFFDALGLLWPSLILKTIHIQEPPPGTG